MARPRSEKELTSEPTPITWRPTDLKIVMDYLKGQPFATWIKQIALDVAQGRLVPPAPKVPENPVPIHATTNGGPWGLTISSEKSTLDVPDWLWKQLGIQAGDGFVRVNGDSMKAAGIASGALVLMRELQFGEKPVTGQIVLVKVRTGLGDVTTLKVWTLDDDGKPLLRDSYGTEYPLPADAKNPQPVSVAQGVIGPVMMKIFPQGK